MRATLWISLALLAACSGDDGDKTDTDTTDGDADTDTDTDADADADTDTDSDADTDTDTDADTDCRADVAWDFDDDGYVEVGGVDDYDDTNFDLLVHSDLYIAYGPYNGYQIYADDYTYDSYDRLVQYDEDSDGNGSYDYSETYAYDSSDNVVLYETDDDYDGTMNYSLAQVYDAYGYLIEVTIDGDEGPDGQWGTADDNQVDGTIDYRSTYTYDAYGYRLTWQEDEGDDGVIELTRTYTREADGDIVTFQDDTDGDGYADSITTYTRDAEDRIVLMERDDAVDGVVDYRETTTYTDPYLLVGSTVYDTNGDVMMGPPQATYTFEVDALGYLLSDSCAGLMAANICGATYSLEYTWDVKNDLLLTIIGTYSFGPPYGDAPIEQVLGWDASNRLIDAYYEYGDPAFYIERDTWTFSAACP